MTLNRSLLLKALVVAGVYALLDILSVVPAIRLPFAAEAVWLPSGFLFAMLMGSPRRQWIVLLPPVVVAAALVNYSQGWSIIGAIGFALTDPAEVLLGAWVAHALLKGRVMDLSRIPDALILGLAGVVNALVAGPAGLLAVHVAGVPVQGAFIGAIWSASVLLAHLFIAPLVIAWPERGPRRNALLAESILWTVLGMGVTWWGLHANAPTTPGRLLMFLPFPLMVGAALRTGPWGASLALAGVSFTALMEGAQGHLPIPMAGLTPDLALFWFQLFLATEAASILVLSCASDAQRRTEGSLLESESRYRHLVEQFPDAILLHDGLRIRYANPAAKVLFGAVPPLDLVGRAMNEFLEGHEPSGAGTLHCSLQERLMKALDGRQIPVEVTDIGISFAGKPGLTLDVFRDLTRRRVAEDALQRAEEGFRQFFDLAPFPLVLSSPGDGRLLRVNRLATDLLEVEGQALEGLSAAHFYVREADRQELLRQVSAEGRVDGMELEALTHKGHPLRLLVSVAPVSYAGGDALLSGFMDVTLRRKTEEALRQTQKLESLGLMAGGIAHDFNNLLTALNGNLELARMVLPEGGSAERHFEAMGTALRRAADLARQMLAYAGQGRVEIQPVDLNASAHELTVLMSASMSKKIELRFELAQGLPLVEGDPVQLQQVLLNLVINAADAIGDRAGTITLATRLEAASGVDARSGGEFPGRHVLLQVADTGQGMSPEVRARIFDPFFTTKTTGRGLGLSAMLGILRSHQATVNVESEPGRGSRFSIRFPLPERAGHSRPGGSGPLPARGALKRMDGLVLLVDDEPGIFATAGTQLHRMGFEVVGAADGVQALQEVERLGESLRVVILDLSMPRMDGAEALVRIRGLCPELPIILSSGFDPNHRMPDLLKLPKVWFLPKPYLLADLCRMVREVLGG